MRIQSIVHSSYFRKRRRRADLAAKNNVEAFMSPSALTINLVGTKLEHIIQRAINLPHTSSIQCEHESVSVGCATLALTGWKKKGKATLYQRGCIGPTNTLRRAYSVTREVIRSRSTTAR